MKAYNHKMFILGFYYIPVHGKWPQVVQCRSTFLEGAQLSVLELERNSLYVDFVKLVFDRWVPALLAHSDSWPLYIQNICQMTNFSAV